MPDRKIRPLSKTVLSTVLASLLVPGVVGAAKNYVVRSGDTLYLIAQRYGTTVSALRQANGLSSDTLYSGDRLRIPSGSGGSGSGSAYTVRSGDTLYLIAQRAGTTVDALRLANGIWTNDLYPGQTITVPDWGVSGGSSGGGAYTVQSGDTLFLIAQRYGTTVDALRQANGIWTNDLRPGQTLTVPSGASGQGSGSGYTVQPGDTLFLIAQRYGTTIAALRQANGLSSDSIYPGMTLRVAGSSTSSGGLTIEPGAGGSGTVWGSKYAITQSNYELLARLVSAEARGEPYSGQIAVAATVLHRLNDSRFPATISGIIYQVYNTYYYQYSPVENGTINHPAVGSAYAAVNEAMNGVDPSGGANGFYNPTGTENTWVTEQPVTAVIGNHVFFRS